MKQLLFLHLLLAVATIEAAPARKPIVWEYATIDLKVTRQITQNYYRYGAELFLPGGKVIFLESKNYGKPAYNTYLLNRLGAQGWELISVTGYRGSEERYIFKRQK